MTGGHAAPRRIRVAGSSRNGRTGARDYTRPVANPPGPQAVQVGVLLARQPHDLGEWLADGAAFDAAGAAALWIDVVAAPARDPLTLAAALAAVTARSLLVATVPAPEPAGTHGNTLATIGRLSRGRLRIVTDSTPRGGTDAGHGIAAFRRVPGQPDTYEHTGRPDQTERWVAAPSPSSRAHWQTTLAEAAGQGIHGLLVPADPRLLDLLRNPDDPGPRRDLQLAQG